MLFILVFFYLGQSTLFDVRTGKLPNRMLVIWMAVLGIWCVGGKLWIAAERWNTVESWGVIVARCAVSGGGYFGRTAGMALVLFPLFVFRMMGAGDVKMMALLGGVFGIRQGFEIIFFGLAAAAVWSLFYMARKRMFLKRIGYFLNYMMRLFYCGEITPYYDASRDGREAGFCLAPFVWIGYCLWLTVRGCFG